MGSQNKITLSVIIFFLMPVFIAGICIDNLSSRVGITIVASIIIGMYAIFFSYLIYYIYKKRRNNKEARPHKIDNKWIALIDQIGESR